MLNVSSVGSSRLAYIHSGSDMGELLSPFEFSDTVIVKPNFVDRVPGTYTAPESLRILFEALDSKIIVAEGHGLIRVLCDEDKGLCFNFQDKERDWSWIPRGGWSHIAKNDDWYWFSEGEHWGHLKELDQKYLAEKGFTDLFKEFDVEYVNVTDEIWEGNVIDPNLVKKEVEEKYGPLYTEKFYGFIPEKLYEHRASTLISFNKFKHYTTFTLKNMFGFIPDPIRSWWHGPKNSRMFQSIIDINKLYMTFFNILGIQEALGITPRSNKVGSFGESGFNYDLLEGSGLVCAGMDRVEVDTLMAGVGSFGIVELDYLEQSDGILGNYRPDMVEQVKDLSPYPR